MQNPLGRGNVLNIPGKGLNMNPSHSSPDWSFFDHLPEAAVFLGSDGQIERMNLQAENLFRRLSSDSPKTANHLNLILDVAGNELHSFREWQEWDYSFQKEIASPEGHLFFQIKMRRFKRPDPFGFATFILVTEITPQLRLSHALAHLNQDLEERVNQRTIQLKEANESLVHYITECKNQAEFLQEFASAVRDTADHIIITDDKGLIHYVNPAFERQTGFTLSELRGKTPRVLKSGEMPPLFFEKLWQAINKGEVFRAEFINKKKNGDIYVEEKTISPIKNAKGEITHFVSVGRDVTKRKEVREDRSQFIDDPQGDLASPSLHLQM